MKHISQNKHEFNEKRHDEISALILSKEEMLKDNISLIKKFKLKAEIKKLYKKLNVIGEEILTFEYQNFNN